MDEGLCISVLHTAARHGLTDLASDVLTQLRLTGIPWTEYHFAPLVEAFCRKNQVKEAFLLLDFMRTSGGITPLPETTLPIFNIISQDVDVVDLASAVLEDMHKAKEPIDRAALNVIVLASVYLEDLQRAVGAYKTFAEYGVEPDMYTFNTLLEGCIKAKHRLLGDRLLTDMKAKGIKPDATTYRNTILICLTQDVYEDAFFYLEEMKGAGFFPTREIYEALILKCISAMDVRKDIALHEMQESGFHISRKLEKAMELTAATAREQVELQGAAARFLESGGLDPRSKEYIETGGLPEGSHEGER